MGRPIHEPSYLSVILELRPQFNTPKTLSLPRNAVNIESQMKEWVEDGLSLKQIGDKLGASKTWVIENLQKLGVEVPRAGRMTNPENYRHHMPPFGFQKRGGKLVPCQKQQRTCKFVVKSKKLEALSFNAIAKLLIKEAHLNGKGGLYWDHKAVKKIYENWKNKY